MASPGTAGIAALGDDPHDDVVHPSAILFVAAHLACLGRLLDRRYASRR